MSIDKDRLYGRFLKSWERRERLADIAARKALDLPADDEMNISTNTTRHGASLLTTALVSAALVFAGGAAALGTAGLLGWPSGAKSPAPRTAAAPSPEPQEFKVSFWADDGTEIRVQEEEPSHDR